MRLDLPPDSRARKINGPVFLEVSMTSRRGFLHLIGTGLIAPGLLDSRVLARQGGAAPGAKASAVFKKAGGVLGIQLYSLRQRMEKDVPGALALVRDWGLTEVETAGYYGRTAAQFAEELKRHGLAAKSMHAGYELLRDKMPQVVSDAKALGVSHVTVAWIPHEKTFTRGDAERAAKHFTEWGRALKGEGLRFMYHLHGYEFAPGPNGTLLDLIYQNTPADAVQFEMDVFWVVRGGGDPAAILTQHKGRYAALHLKDMAKGTKTGDFTGGVPDNNTNVPLGTGMIDYGAVLRAARESGTTLYYIEDESDKVVEQVPQTLTYLAGVTF
jgi:sugar phosphate isomerase/epimerase